MQETRLEKIIALIYGWRKSLDNIQESIDRFHIHYEQNRIWENARWLGVPIWKLPFDAFIIQELIYKIKPDYIIETGTGKGGSAVFYASILELIGKGTVITIDIDPSFNKNNIQENLRKRIIQITGDSVSHQVFTKVDALTAGEKSLVLLDSWHIYYHVLKELELYSQFVSTGSYIIVEDTHINNPVPWEYGDDGPMEAVKKFLSMRDDFIADKECEKHGMTFNPNGYLKRVK